MSAVVSVATHTHMQVHNALGFCYFSMEKTDLAIAEYRKAVDLQQGYVTAWNNLGDAYERSKQWRCGCGWARSSAVLNRGAFAKWCVQRPIQLRVCANLELPAASPTPPACLPALQGRAGRLPGGAGVRAKQQDRAAES